MSLMKLTDILLQDSGQEVTTVLHLTVITRN